MIKFVVTITSAVSEPRTTATATTSFPRFRDDAAFGAHRTDGRRNDCWCLHVGIGQHEKEEMRYKIGNKSLSMQVCTCMYVISLERTFASHRAVGPTVTNFPVTDTSTILKPSTTRSTTTDSAGFLKRAASWARHRTGHRRTHYQLSISWWPTRHHGLCWCRRTRRLRY